MALTKSNHKTRFDRFMSKYDDLPKPLRRGKYRFIILMLILSVFSWALFYVYVNFSSFVMAFKEFQGYDASHQPIYEWSLNNFRRFWTDMLGGGRASDAFSAAFKNTLFFFVFGNAFCIPIQFIVSYYLYKKITGGRVFKILLYMPHILSTVVMVTIFKNIVEVHGLISGISQRINGTAVSTLLSTPEHAKWTILMYNNWTGFAGSYIIISAGMSRIPQEVIESAKLDGITPWKEFWKIIVPMIWPTIHIFLIHKIAGILSADAPILLLTEGRHDTVTIGYWYYKQVILSHSFEYPSAVGLMLTMFIAPIAIISRKLLDKVYADVEF